MSQKTTIEWADSTWSPWRGCTKVSPGCANCYAEVLSRRNPKVLGEWGRGKPRVRTVSAGWRNVRRWNRAAGHNGTRMRVFPSLCDWLDDEVPVEWIADFLRLVQETPNLDWLLLTKRPENWSCRLKDVVDLERQVRGNGLLAVDWISGIEPRNVWLGVSVEDQQRAEERIPVLLQTPARVRFLSAEPLLGPVDLLQAAFDGSESFSAMGGLDWVIVGGESGPRARPCNVEWIRDIVRQCGTAKVPCFVKQLGANYEDPPNGVGGVLARPDPTVVPPIRHLRDRKGGDPSEWPEVLRVRQMPEVRP